MTKERYVINFEAPGNFQVYDTEKKRIIGVYYSVSEAARKIAELIAARKEDEAAEKTLPVSLILAMREPHLSRLLNGEKHLELRRNHPAHVENVGRLYLYMRGYIHGYVEVVDVEQRGACTLHSIASRWHQGARLTYQDAYTYLNGAYKAVAYRVCKPVRFKEPVAVCIRPQSWMYATPEIVLECNKRMRKEGA